MVLWSKRAEIQTQLQALPARNVFHTRLGFLVCKVGTVLSPPSESHVVTWYLGSTRPGKDLMLCRCSADTTSSSSLEGRMETRALKFQGSNHSWEVWKRRLEDQESEGGLGLVSPAMHMWCEPVMSSSGAL